LKEKIYIAHTETIDPALVNKIKIMIQECGYSPLDPFDRGRDIPPNMIVRSDLMKILSSRMVVVILSKDHYSLGTPMEMVYARIFGKPVLTVLLTPSLSEHYWVKEHSTKMVLANGWADRVVLFEDVFRFCFKVIVTQRQTECIDFRYTRRES